MIDRFGKRVIVGWAEHEVLWLKAAMTLPKRERLEAFRDISEMTGRTYASVYYYAARIECQRQEDALICRAHFLSPIRPAAPQHSRPKAPEIGPSHLPPMPQAGVLGSHPKQQQAGAHDGH